MGVTHKLKSQVVDFIVQTKKQAPKMGVRKLAELASQQFSIKISKSSVSNVLKDAALSSSVGRPKEMHAVEKKVKQFEIPQQTKAAIRNSIIKTGLELKGNDEDLNDGDGNLENSKNKELASFNTQELAEVLDERGCDDKEGEDLLESLSEPEQSRKKTDDVVHLIPDPIEEDGVNSEISSAGVDQNQYVDFAVGHAEEVRRRKQGILKNLKPGMGSIFLHVANHDLSTKPLLGEFFKNLQIIDGVLNVNSIVQEEMFRLLWEKYGQTDVKQECMRFFNVKPQDKEVFNKKIDLEKPSAHNILSYQTEKDQLEMQIGGVKLQLWDGSKIILNGTLSEFCDLNEFSDIQTLNTAARVLSRRVVSNIEPIVLRNIGDLKKKDVSQNFIRMCANDGDKKMVKAQLLSPRGEEIVSFSTLPKIKRNMIFGVYPGQELFEKYKNLLSTEKNSKMYYDEHSDKLVSYDDVVVEYDVGCDGKKVPLKVLGVGESGCKQLKCIVLSNMIGVSGSEILQKYFQKWPDVDFQESKRSNIEHKNLEKTLPQEKGFLNINKIDTYEKIILNFGESLHEFVKRHYLDLGKEFDVNTCFSNIYAINGALEVTPKHTCVYLKLPDEVILREGIKRASSLINERQVVDDRGRIIYIKLLS